MPAPAIKNSGVLWERVWRAQDLSSLLFWFLSTLRVIEEQGRHGVIVLASSTAGRALSRALANEGVAVKHLGGSLSTRLKAMAAFISGKAHAVVTYSDILAGAGFPGARDVVIGEDVSAPEPNMISRQDDILRRFRCCCNVFTYTRVRSHADF